MLEYAMNITIETLWQQGKNKSEISKITGHDWKTVSKVVNLHPKLMRWTHPFFPNIV